MREYLCFIAVRRFDVVHDINVDIIQNNTGFGHIGSLPKNGAKDDTGFCRRHLDQTLSTCMLLNVNEGKDLDRRLDALETVWRNRVHRWPFDDLKITEGSEI